MKKIISLLLVSLFIFTFSSCTIKINTPEIPQSFNQNAVVTSGDFSFECEICKNEEIVSVKVKNTNALGLIMIYDGNTVNFKYRHSGWIGGLKETKYRLLMQQKPELAMQLAVRGMLPRNIITKDSLSRLHIYRGAEHPHTAQKPETWAAI